MWEKRVIDGVMLFGCAVLVISREPRKCNVVLCKGNECFKEVIHDVNRASNFGEEINGSLSVEL